VCVEKHARRYGRVKVQRKELLASTSSLVMVAIARIHYSVIVLHGSHTNGKEKKKRKRARKEFHTLRCLDKIKQEKNGKQLLMW
jgi:hypothetical protein